MTGMMRACLICGRPSKESRCELHREQHYAHPVACSVCGKPGPKSWCDEHDPHNVMKRTEPERRAAQPWREAYSYPEYHRERAAALRRCGGACEGCGRTDRPLEADHVIPLSSESTPEGWHRLTTRGNLRMLCTGPGGCHPRKTKLSARGPRRK